MASRTAWAVTAAELLLDTLRVTMPVQAGQARQVASHADRAYRDALWAIGTASLSQQDELYDATVNRGLTVTQALDAIGA